MDSRDLIEQYQQQMLTALISRVQAIESTLGDHFGFEVVRDKTGCLLIAHRWPHARHEIPFNRIYNYDALEQTTGTGVLSRWLSKQLDIIIEVGAGAASKHSGLILQRYSFIPRWEIVWLHTQLSNFTPRTSSRRIRTREISPDEMDLLATLVIKGYEYQGINADYWYLFAKYGYTALGTRCFLAEVDGEPAGFGVLHRNDKIAWVDGAATLPRYRGLGVQTALLTARLQYARNHGCSYVFSRTVFRSISHYNMEKIGMQVVYRSTAWRRQVVGIRR